MPRNAELVKAEASNARRMLGGTVVKVAVDPEANSWAFQLRFPNGRKADVWVMCDPEGNGPGHLDIVHPEKGG